MADRTPTLADRFLYTGSGQDLLRRGVADAVRARLRQARRFVLDPQGTRRFAEVVRDEPGLLIREQRSARAPYDVCWIEFPFPAFYETVSGRPTTAGGDAQLGYLVDHGSIYVVCGGTVAEPSARPVLMPVSYRLHEPWEVEDQVAFCGRVRTSRMQIDAFLWGESFLRIGEEERRALRAAHSCTLLTPGGPRDAGVFSHMVEASSGDLRNAVALLLLLNRPSLTRYVREAAPARHFLRGRQRVFLAHTVVTIPIDPRPVLRLAGTPQGEAVARRRHEVRGHYCHDRLARDGGVAGCLHAWEPDPAYPADDGGHFLCPACRGRRWWRTTHGRGDASAGFSASSYRITAGTVPPATDGSGGAA